MPRLRKQLLVAAHFAKLALVHDEDDVGLLHGGEAVRDDDRGAALNHALQGQADAQLGVGVDRGSGFVEDQDARVVRQGAGEVDELLLSRWKANCRARGAVRQSRREAT